VVPSPDIGGPSVSEVRILNPATSAVTVVSPKGSVARDLSWSPDGRYLVFEAAGIWRVRADGTDLRRLTEGDSPSWSPDGFRLAFTRIEFLRQSVQSSIFIMNSDGTDVRRLTVDDALNADPAWAP
jgi:TolB protein